MHCERRFRMVLYSTVFILSLFLSQIKTNCRSHEVLFKGGLLKGMAASLWMLGDDTALSSAIF